MNRKHLIVMISFGAAFAVVSYLGYALLIKPVNKKIRDKQAEIEDVDKKLKDAKSKAAQYDKFKAQAENIRRDLTLISLRLDPDLSLREINRIGSKFLKNVGVSEILTSKRDKVKEPGFTSLEGVQYVLTFKGGYHEFGNLLNSAISGHRMIVPTLIDFKVGEEELYKPTMDGKVTLGVFVDAGGAK